MTEATTGAASLADLVRASRLPSVAERKRIRAAAGVSLRQVGEALGVSAETVWSWENDQWGPSKENAPRYRKLLDELAAAAGTQVIESAP
jgi:transcriptional regulator with XRE-family HTH domain